MYFKKITASDFGKLEEMLKSKKAMLLIYADWCVHCKMFKPVWADFIQQIKNNKQVKDEFIFLEIESQELNKLRTKDPKLYKYITVTQKSPGVYFPKIMFFTHAGTRTTRTEYDGGKTVSDLTSFITSKLSKPPSQGSKSRGDSTKLQNKSNVLTFSKKSPAKLINDMLEKYMRS